MLAERSVTDAQDEGRTRRVRRGLARPLLHAWRPPRESRRLLAEMRVFAHCSPRQILRVARWGDVIEVQPGDVLVREDRTDYWFFAILDGSMQITHNGKVTATLQRGDHFGEVAIIGFRPQPATVTAAEPSVLFVLGRRYLMSLGVTDPSVQHALFPNMGTRGYDEFVRNLQQEGRRQWERLRPRYAGGETLPESRLNPPGESIGWTTALELLSHRDLERLPPGRPPPDLPGDGRRFSLIASLVVIAILACTAVLYHPPFAVLTSGQAIDVVQDISITGAKVDHPSGRYLLTPVNIARPNLAGMAFAWITRRLVVATASPDADELDPQARRRLAHEAFLLSHRNAIALAERRLGVDARGVTIAIRDRGITGPSAGLIYALAIVDMLDRSDLAAGRVIAATGELRPDGAVVAVAFVSLKAKSAQAEGATLFLVPASQRDEARDNSLAVVGVTSLQAAVEALRRTH